MLRTARVCATALLVVGTDLAAANACSTDDVLTLARQGYAKAEIERLCGQRAVAGPASKAAPAPAPGIESRLKELLAAATEQDLQALVASPAWSNALTRVDAGTSAYKAILDDAFDGFMNIGHDVKNVLDSSPFAQIPGVKRTWQRESIAWVRRETSGPTDTAQICAQINRLFTASADRFASPVRMIEDFRSQGGAYTFGGFTRGGAVVRLTCHPRTVEAYFSWRQ